jgi:hypothetical protein
VSPTGAEIEPAQLDGGTKAEWEMYAEHTLDRWQQSHL